MRLTLSSKRRHTTSYAVVSYQILLVISVICSIAQAHSPPAPTIELSGLVIKQLDKDLLPSKTAEAVETKTVTIVVEATPKTYNPNDDDDDNSDNSWQNGGHVKPNIVATGDSTSSAEPTNTAAGNDNPQSSPLPNSDGVDDNYTDPNPNGVKRLVLISSLVGTVGFVSLLAAATLLYMRKRSHSRRNKTRNDDIELNEHRSRGGDPNDGSDGGSSRPILQRPYGLPDEAHSLPDSEPSAPMLAPLPMAHTPGNDSLRQHYLEIPSLSHDGSPSRSMRTLAHTQAIPPPSAPTAKELNDDHANLYHLVARDYPSSSAGLPSGSRPISTFRDDSSVTSSQDAPPAYTPSAPPLYILADYPEPHIIGTSRSRQQHDRAPSRHSRRE
ncbi:hypothetical protein K450DRAFT_241614 [Umbelopsis ramanniana AG]|uniref:Uncharacterized protein n=1 Tax=Umbelopsis ramanniana AG TaxID=1314678 RepID=A0AAD5HCT1_UMBRA|nr:uncharacterized protein K450DRAFT_241614 [Umbelopsis ramanniana AG]KAI8579570.1 hypothetical protein K450DRAFT_241614 [Umbelopsis ramanniana AG]